MKALAEALGEVLGEARGRRVLWAAIEPIEPLDAARGANRATVDALPEGDFDAVVLGASAGDLGPAARAARQRVRAGGVLAVVVPIERAGIRALTQSVLGAFQPSRRPRALEEVCAALLCAGVSPVKVIDVKGARGDAVVHGVVQSAPAIV